MACNIQIGTDFYATCLCSPICIFLWTVLVTLPRLGQISYHFDDSRTLQYTPILIWKMINLFLIESPQRFFHNAIAWPELNFIFKGEVHRNIELGLRVAQQKREEQVSESLSKFRLKRRKLSIFEVEINQTQNGDSVTYFARSLPIFSVLKEKRSDFIFSLPKIWCHTCTLDISIAIMFCFNLYMKEIYSVINT